MVRGDIRSERISELQIIDDNQFAKVQDILKQRNGKNEEKRTVAMTNRGKSLLSGNIYCAHCGCRLTSSRHIDKYTRADGTVVRKDSGIYVCYHRSRKLNDCDGATTYYSDKVDNAVLETLRYIFSNISGCPEEEKIQEAYRKSIENNKKEQKTLGFLIEKDTNQLEVLRLEIGRALIGESAYSSDDLSTAINTLRERIKKSQKRLEILTYEDNEKKQLSESIIPAYRQFRTWADEFEETSFQAKKMIANQIFPELK